MTNLPRLVKIHIGEWKPAIIYKRGTKYTKAAINTGMGIKTMKLKNRDADQAAEMDYSLDKAIRHFRRFSKRGTMNKEIRSLLYDNNEQS